MTDDKQQAFAEALEETPIFVIRTSFMRVRGYIQRYTVSLPHCCQFPVWRTPN